MPIELLVFAENPLSEVYLILNSTEYLMAFNYQIDAHRSVWYLELNTLNVGNYEVKIKMIEVTDEIHNNTLGMIKVIPATPLLVQNDWSVEKAGDLDYISGFLTIDSYYDIFLIEIWIDGELITVMEISNGYFSYYGYVNKAKTHTMKVSVKDSQNRELSTEFLLGLEGGLSSLAIIAIISVVGILAIAGAIAYVGSKLKTNSLELDESEELDLPEIEIDDDQDTVLTQTSNLNDRESLNEIEDLFDSNLDSQQIAPEPIGVVTATAVQKKKKKAKKKSKPKPQVIEIIDTSEPLDKKAEAELAQVKEYIDTVKEDGLIEIINGNGSAPRTNLERLSTFSIEIDDRVLPEQERLQKASQNDAQEIDSTLLSLKDIADEIEQTLSE